MGPGDLANLLAGSAEVAPAGGLERKLALGRPLRIKLGLDPTAPAVTLGWAVVLRKLRQFQDAGHQALLIVGDFTAQVGDPSGRSDARPQLSKKEVKAHAQKLLDQFWIILDQQRTEIRYNSEWLARLRAQSILELASSVTVAKMLEREDFAKRYEQGRPISIMEFLYPLLQGYDSVAVKSDVEIGGTDQAFNLLVGRDLQRQRHQDPQVALTMPLLVGTDGVQKMSQSLGNYISITDSPDEMFGKLVRVPDEILGEYRLLVLDFFRNPVKSEHVERGLAEGTLSPWQEKRRLAREVVDLYHGPGAGDIAQNRFNDMQEHVVPPNIVEVPFPTEWLSRSHIPVAEILVALGLAASRSEARRLILQRGVRMNGVLVRDARQELGRDQAVNSVWQVGRRKFVRLAAPFG